MFFFRRRPSDLDRVNTTLLRMEQFLMSSLNNLTAEVADVKNVMASALTLINGFQAQLAAAIAAAQAGDSTALDTLSTDLKTSADALAAAVAANTPAAASQPDAPSETPVPAAPAPTDSAPSTDAPAA